MSKNKIKSSFVNILASVIQQAVSIVLGFVSRMLFIHILGVEILGLNNTFESILGTLALADLGLQRAITYSLYKPFEEKNTERINEILNIYKWFYRVVGIFIIVASGICMPLLNKLISGIEFQHSFYLFFGLLAINSATSYFLAYKRVLLYVDQVDYISKIIDTSCSFIFLILKIATLYLFKSYIIYLSLQILQTLVSNIWVQWICNRKYSYIGKAKFNKVLFKDIWKDMKNVLFGKIASFVYDSTDNLVISALISTVMVGMIGNYTLITTSVKKIINSLTNPLAPIIGRMLAGDDNEKKKESFLLCTQFCYAITLVLLVPTGLLLDDFIVLWIGKKYVMESAIPYMLVADLFLFTMHGICCSYIFGDGLFNQEKYVDIIAAVLNLSTSIVFAKIIGIKGVLLGTIISEIFIWIGRSYITYIYSLKTNISEYVIYWKNNIVRLAYFVFCVLIGMRICNHIFICNGILEFILKGFIIEIITIVGFIIIFGYLSEHKKMLNIIINFAIGRIKKI